ncbi:helix-turn-helix domain-containing protein [Leptotrichia sp. OH3620_COT-345]|uniref:XRE family transcriptional regulator n=1 Tax=Leptotrichia sp. OH3620_COT-345 TaxID=2491048 RepID=UPI000F64D1EB|nr:S24 family peptidase [Leptotrichia sp. OH3620_COT-345]RRD38790.1 helix-turn-helix domain-containing protein [Leptotrichia sp. OH3620_COT-345]
MKFEVDDNKMLRFAEFLRNLRNEKKYTLEQIKKATGIGISDINQLENGMRKKINPFHLVALSNIYKINVLKFYEMLGYINKEKIDSYVEKEAIEKNVAEIFDEKSNMFEKIPLFSSVAAGAGKIVDEIPETYIQVPLSGKNFRAAYISGDSMEPTLVNGGIVVFDPHVEKLKNGDIGVFYLNGEYFVKRFYKGSQGVFLQSDNHIYMPMLVKEHDDFKIWGKCTGTINEL